MPSAAANPCSRAATSTAQSTSGTNAATTRSAIAVPRPQQRGRGHERAREIGDLTVLVHRRSPQQDVRSLLGAGALLHDDAFCLVDDLAILQRRFRLIELALEPVEGMKSADRDVENRPHAF